LSVRQFFAQAIRRGGFRGVVEASGRRFSREDSPESERSSIRHDIEFLSHIEVRSSSRKLCRPE
jgi:hypothetical protein